MSNRVFSVFSGNQLKILAIVLMTLDHIGMLLFPSVLWLRIVGRAAFPIFAYMIAEGCFHTRSRRRYFFTLAAVALPCQIVYALAMHSLEQCVLVTFALSVALISLFDRARRMRSIVAWIWFVLGLAVIVGGILMGEAMLSSWHFRVDYGVVGVLLPLIIYLGRHKWERLALAAVGLVLLSLCYAGIQWWCLTALIPLAFYSGERGRFRLKYLFYIYYPLHLVILYGISLAM